MISRNIFIYYVYELIDPRDLVPFYVGKGKGNRIDCHEKEALDGRISRKCNKIREIKTSGLEILKRKVAMFCEEQAAYDYEEELINNYGLENLTNVLPGGSKAYIRIMKEKRHSVFGKSISDEASVKILARYIKITNWFKELPGYYAGTKFVEVPAEMTLIMKECLRDLFKKDFYWTKQELAKNNVFLIS